eukprot:3448385-Ditylum_brightwellii.AAC.1
MPASLLAGGEEENKNSLHHDSEFHHEVEDSAPMSVAFSDSVDDVGEIMSMGMESLSIENSALEDLTIGSCSITSLSFSTDNTEQWPRD